LNAELRARALQWLEADPDDTSRAELGALLARGDEAELADRFAGSLAFGTAGLRGVLGAGPNRMNRAVVIRATAGLAAHALEATVDAARRGVVVGCDARRMSRELAHEAARVIAAAGIRVHLFDDIVPTPLVSFAVAHLGAAAGVMVTASHNPAPYNGFKVYWDDGAQIVAPTDVHIARAIERAPGAKDVPRAAIDDGRVSVVPVSVCEAYFSGMRRCVSDAPIRIVYTPLHGVGWAYASRALGAAGFADVIPVPEQMEPDGAFPTTPFPNPEEPGVLALATALAERTGADLVLANDPDADRLAVAVPGPDGRFVQLTGNQVSVLLGEHLMRNGEGLVVTTIVSTPMLGAIARARGCHCEETLTGFKWLEHRAMELERAHGARLLFACEEALGYTVGDHVRDKDGIGAAVCVAEIASACKAAGTTVRRRLEALYREYGLFASAQRNVIRTGPRGMAEMADMMRRLRAARMQSLGGRRVVEISDYLAGGVRGLPASDVVGIELEAGTRVVVRPSGTEPKVKVYLDHREVVGRGEAIDDAERRAQAAMTEIGDAVLGVIGG
jgi:phosphomannomutase